MEELSYRHMYRIDRAHIGNFHLSSAAGSLDREDDLCSNGLRGLADFAAAVFKVIEAQQRGFAHGHGKIHSVPDGSNELHDSLDNVAREVAKLQEANGDGLIADEDILAVVDKQTQSHNACLIGSASTRPVSYTHLTLPTKRIV